MNAPLHPEVLIRADDEAQSQLPLETEGVARWVWESRFGPMLIEVKDQQVFVNGAPVEPMGR